MKFVISEKNPKCHNKIGTLPYLFYKLHGNGSWHRFNFSSCYKYSNASILLDLNEFCNIYIKLELLSHSLAKLQPSDYNLFM